LIKSHQALLKLDHCQTVCLCGCWHQDFRLELGRCWHKHRNLFGKFCRMGRHRSAPNENSAEFCVTRYVTRLPKNGQTPDDMGRRSFQCKLVTRGSLRS
jgi:hypothetical protein